MRSTRACRRFTSESGEYWEVPYLPIDPADIGREYEPIVRINSQSGKGGVAFVMDTFYGFKLPKGMHKEFADVIQKISEKQGEVAPEQIMDEFQASCYLDRKEPIHFRKCQITDTEVEDGAFATLAKVTYTDHGMEKDFRGRRKRPDRCSAAGTGEGSWASRSRCWTTPSTHCAPVPSTGSILHSSDGSEDRQCNLRCGHQLQYHQVFHPRYLQRGEQAVLLKVNEHTGRNSNAVQTN